MEISQQNKWTMDHSQFNFSSIFCFAIIFNIKRIRGNTSCKMLYLSQAVIMSERLRGTESLGNMHQLEVQAHCMRPSSSDLHFRLSDRTYITE